jgi:hypothetical protein
MLKVLETEAKLVYDNLLIHFPWYHNLFMKSVQIVFERY